MLTQITMTVAIDDESSMSPQELAEELLRMLHLFVRDHLIGHGTNMQIDMFREVEGETEFSGVTYQNLKVSQTSGDQEGEIPVRKGTPETS